MAGRIVVCLNLSKHGFLECAALFETRAARVEFAASDLSDETQNTRVVEKATLPEKKADNFNALSARLLADANRGLITDGNVVDRKINVIKFAADPTPLMTLTVIYYQKN